MISRRQFVQAITGTLAALGVEKTQPTPPEAIEFQWHAYPPLDGPITGRAIAHDRVLIFTERSVYDAGPASLNLPLFDAAPGVSRAFKAIR